MAHYAFLDENNIVTEVIVGKDENEDNVDWEGYYGDLRGQTCKRTSYNTLGNVHRNGGTPYRKNYAGIGFSYDANLDAFIPPKPFNSWVLNEDTCFWQAPVEVPEDVGTGEPPKAYDWDEDNQQWIEVPNGA